MIPILPQLFGTPITTFDLQNRFTVTGCSMHWLLCGTASCTSLQHIAGIVVHARPGWRGNWRVEDASTCIESSAGHVPLQNYGSESANSYRPSHLTLELIKVVRWLLLPIWTVIALKISGRIDKDYIESTVHGEVSQSSDISIAKQIHTSIEWSKPYFSQKMLGVKEPSPFQGKQLLIVAISLALLVWTKDVRSQESTDIKAKTIYGEVWSVWSMYH